MINLSLNYDQRINLELLLGQQQGDLRTTSALMRVITSIRLDESERQACNLRLESGRIMWTQSEYPLKPVAIENSDASKVREIVERYDKFVPSDLVWVEPIVSALPSGSY